MRRSPSGSTRVRPRCIGLRAARRHRAVGHARPQGADRRGWRKAGKLSSATGWPGRAAPGLRRRRAGPADQARLSATSSATDASPARRRRLHQHQRTSKYRATTSRPSLTRSAARRRCAVRLLGYEAGDVASSRRAQRRPGCSARWARGIPNHGGTMHGTRSSRRCSSTPGRVRRHRCQPALRPLGQ